VIRLFFNHEKSGETTIALRWVRGNARPALLEKRALLVVERKEYVLAAVPGDLGQNEVLIGCGVGDGVEGAPEDLSEMEGPAIHDTESGDGIGHDLSAIQQP
jgi:hypothetical protein